MGLVADLPAEKVEVPSEARQATQDTVHAGIPLERMLRTMWSAHVATLDALLSHLWTQSGAPASARRTSLDLWSREERRVRQLSFSYLEAFSDWMTREYLAERDAWAGSLASARRAIVTDIIEGRRIVTRDAESTLGLRLTDPHMALVIWAESEKSDEVQDSELMSTATALGRAARATSTLTVHGAPSTLWTWLGWRQQPDPAQATKLSLLVDPPPGIRVAIGPIMSGRIGLRRSHGCAKEAQRIGLTTREPFCHYADIAAVSLLTMNMEHAQWFVEDTLGQLAADNPRTAELRTTLHAYLSSGRSRSAAATSLHIASGTVAYRLRQAEEILGTPIEGPGRDIQLALEILAVTPPATAGR